MIWARSLHARTQADDDLGTRSVRCFVGAFDDAGLPDDKLRAALQAYIEWAVREVMSYAPANAVVPAGLPIPRWTWEARQAEFCWRSYSLYAVEGSRMTPVTALA